MVVRRGSYFWCSTKQITMNNLNWFIPSIHYCFLFKSKCTFCMCQSRTQYYLKVCRYPDHYSTFWLVNFISASSPHVHVPLSASCHKKQLIDNKDYYVKILYIKHLQFPHFDYTQSTSCHSGQTHRQSVLSSRWGKLRVPAISFLMSSLLNHL